MPDMQCFVTQAAGQFINDFAEQAGVDYNLVLAYLASQGLELQAHFFGRTDLQAIARAWYAAMAEEAHISPDQVPFQATLPPF